MSLESCIESSWKLLTIAVFNLEVFLGATGVTLVYAGVWKIVEGYQKRREERTTDY